MIQYRGSIVFGCLNAVKAILPQYNIYNEFASFTENHVHFDIKGLSNLTEILPLIGMEGIKSFTR